MRNRRWDMEAAVAERTEVGGCGEGRWWFVVKDVATKTNSGPGNHVNRVTLFCIWTQMR